MKNYLVLIVCLVCSICGNSQTKKEAFRNEKLPMDVRVKDLLSKLTLEEKIALLGFQNKSVDRLNIPAYNWWNEALHGIARAGEATVFPQAIAMAATFDKTLIKQVGDAISTEARAKYNLATKADKHLQYMGLTFWSPNINIFRDPRWGRGQETYGEDPFLTASMGTSFIKGLQGNNLNFLKTSACAKHFAVHSGPEATRHAFNAVVDEKDLRETYLYAFKKMVDSGVESIMCGYNRVNGEPCCTGQTLLQYILRNEWQFKGHVVTDCGALDDIFARHKVFASNVEVAAAAIKAGVNLDCSTLLQKDVMKAIDQHLLNSVDVDSALAGILRTQFKLGFYNDASLNPFSKYGADSVANTYHTLLARKTAEESMVLLKNDKNILPLDKKKYNAVMVVGPNAASLDALLGNYHGVTSKAVNFVEGITAAVGAGARVEYDQGCDYTDTTHFGGIWAASNADITVAVMGLTPVYEGEEGDAFLAAGGGDRKNLALPASQIAFLKALRKGTKTPIIVVVTAGSAIDVSTIEPYADAIVYAWYPGEQGGTAFANILFGNVSPSGHLPITFYHSFDDLPAYDNYAMKERTYRYYDGKVQYPFGFGLSYTSFNYEWKKTPQITITAKDTISFSVKIKNTGLYDGDEVAQAYIEYPTLERMPLKELKAFKRLHVTKGKEGTMEFLIPASELLKWDLKEQGWKLYAGEYNLCINKNANEQVLKSKIIVK